MSPPTRLSTVHVRSAHGAEPNQRSIAQPNSAPPAIVPEKLMPRAVYHPARTNGLGCATQSGACRGKQGERRERAGERERLAQRRSTTCGALDARREWAAAGGRSERAARSPGSFAAATVLTPTLLAGPQGLSL